jgi:hypothetical protein
MRAETGDPDRGSEADLIEQALPVDEPLSARTARDRGEVAEADWVEQTLEVPLDDYDEG